MSARISKVVVVGRDAALWLSAAVIQKALRPSGVSVEAVELPSALGAADVYTTLPPLEALHSQLQIDEAVLLRRTQGSFSLGQNFVDASGEAPAFLHAYGSAGAQIDGRDFFAYWLKARGLGLQVGLEDFSLTAAAARHGRLMIPDDESEIYGRSDYGYHLPAADYVGTLKALAAHFGVVSHRADAVGAELDPECGCILRLNCGDGRSIEGQLFIDAAGLGGDLIGAGLAVSRESWRVHFPTDRLLVASGPKFQSTPVYAEIRACEGGWSALYPSRAQTHVVHAYSNALSSDEEALASAASNTGLSLANPVVRALDQGPRIVAWERNCIAIGEAACMFDPIHGVDLHAVQLGLVHLLACFPTYGGFEAERAEYNRVTRSAFARIRDFQSVHYALNRYGSSPLWTQAREAAVSPELAHRIGTFRARGEVAPWEDDSFLPDSWRALFIGHGLAPESYLPTVDRTPPEEMKAQFRRMLGFVKEQVLRQPTHDQYLERIWRGQNA